MKKIKLIFTTLAILLLMPSCENDGGNSKINFKNGALTDLQKISTTDSFINLIAVNSGDDINLGFTVEKAIGDFSSMDIVGFYTKANGTIYKATLVSNVTTFPATFNISKTDLFDAFEELNTASDFELGDKLIITNQLTLEDGSIQRIINDDGSPNYSPNIASSGLYKVFLSYGVSCPSDLGGTYSVLSSGASTDSGPTPSENPIANFPYTTVITDNGGGSYTMDDAFGGLLILWYDIYDLTFKVKGEFTDVCGNLSGSFTGAFGEINTITGGVNPNGSLNIHWENEWGDYGDAIYTKD